MAGVRVSEKSRIAEILIEHRVRRLVALLLIALTGLSGAAVEGQTEATTMTYSHVRPESDSDARAQLAWDVLRVALERTRMSYGDYSIVTSRIEEPQRRLLRHADTGWQSVNISLLPVPAGTEAHNLVPVRIPVYGGLWGYRVLLIRAGEQARFDQIRSLADLRMMTIGQAEFWADVAILKSAGFNVKLGASYDGLFKMLRTGRFDAMSRSVIEVLDELKAHKDLAVERNLLLHYPMPEYFWFSDDPSGRRLAARVNVGLLSMVADGSLRRMVKSRFAKTESELDLKHRHVIELPNPLLGGADQVSDPALWYNLDKD